MSQGTRVNIMRFQGERFLVISRELPQAHRALTAAEVDVAERLMRGDSQRAIGIARGCSGRTVANQAQSIYRKLGVTCREELVTQLGSATRTA